MSYRGTETHPILVMALSRRHHSVQLMEYRPRCAPGLIPMAMKPADACARVSYTCL